MPGEVWFAVLPDSEAGLAAAGALRPYVGEVIVHGSGRPWLAGRWPAGQVTVAEAGAARAAVIGRCPITVADLAARLADIREAEQAERLVAGLAGSFHLVVSVGGRVRVRGTASATRRVFHARVAGATVAASRSDILAAASGAEIDPEVLASRLLPPGAVYALEQRSVWRGVSSVSPDHCLVLDARGRHTEHRWWSPPVPELTLGQGAAAVRDALGAAVASCTAGGGTVSADLSGGLDSTSLCFLAARGRAELVTSHAPGLDPSNDDTTWARRAAAALPVAVHLSADPGLTPLSFAGMAGPHAALEEPGGWVRDAARLHDLAERMTARGSRLHLMGGGGDELFSPVPALLHDLVRSHPLLALRRLRAHRAGRRRGPLAPALRALADRGDYGTWLGSSAARLAAGPPPATAASVGWGPELRMPPWATPEAVEAAREALVDALAAAPEPLSPQRAQHAALLYVRTGGNGLRQIDQATSRAGLPYTAPFLDDAVVEAALSVRTHERGAQGRYKPLLRAAMAGIVPEPLLTRTTKGEYGVDVHTGLRRHRDDLLGLLDSSLLARRGLIDDDAARAALLDPHPAGTGLAPLIQTLTCEVWLRSQVASPKVR
ncbi:asparagine synthase [Microtetraspora sp. NBRC 13810]|uniref:asparagine synthase-related protein n=1 Tax=Microtetraspora sp. NBRC 13810 TaxID=3030990 RepID=UPI00249FAE1A|nr:asparagine synthase-related protein [Microtetraspora sp. NBRC 13810]GLW09538.1 asparagine synthase [Microtetraspora sp. NBRC 13810]